MKNLVLLASQSDIHQACYELLQSPVIQKSYEVRGVVFNVIDEYARLPRIIFDYTDHSLERGHFNSYWGTLARRDYGDALAISDLYYLHEMKHQNVANYQHEQAESIWINRMSREEAYVSVFTELLIYFELPDLRKKVQFPGWVIWADRFLSDEVKIYEWKENRMIRRNPNLGKNPKNSDLFMQDRELFITFAIERRGSIMYTPHPELLDPQEKAIHSYGLNNFAWSDIWRSVRHRVEDAMLILESASKVDRKIALDWHQAFLEREQWDRICPFEAQAREFKRFMDAFYAENNTSHLDKK